MSDSLKATVITIWLVSTISANGELEPEPEDDDEAPPPKVPAVVPAPAAPDPPLLEAAEDELPPEPLELAPAGTASPGVRLASETMVPLAGAWSWVLVNSDSALLRFACALYTAAWADAMLPGDGVVVVVVGVVVVLLRVEPEALDPVELEPVDPVELEALDPVELERVDPVKLEAVDLVDPEALVGAEVVPRAGVVAVVLRAGVVCVVVRAGAVVAVVDVLEVVPGAGRQPSATNSALAGPGV